MTSSDILHRVLRYIPLLLSLSVHEWAHAYSAFLLGDDTAARQGRLTLNPIVHIDPIGTLLLPLFSPFGFGWAKPVPINPVRFRRDIPMRTGMMITAAAGPLSNLAIALVASVALGLLLRFGVVHWSADGFIRLLESAIYLNLVLCLFNFLPIPPLDGSRIVDGLIPYRLRPQWEMVERYSSFGLILAIIAGGYLLAVPLDYAAGLFRWIIRSVAGG
jgi:Zn-dependent protease